MVDKSVKIRGKVKDGVAKVKVLISHPMETGTRRHAESGELIPAKYIEEVVFSHNGNDVLTAFWGTSVSKNPYSAFKIKSAVAGDKVAVRWSDNTGASGAKEIALK